MPTKDYEATNENAPFGLVGGWGNANSGRLINTILTYCVAVLGELIARPPCADYQAQVRIGYDKAVQ